MSIVKTWSRKKRAAQKEKKAMEAPDLRVRTLKASGGGGEWEDELGPGDTLGVAEGLEWGNGWYGA